MAKQSRRKGIVSLELAMAPLPVDNGATVSLSALDDPKWKRVNEKMIALLRRAGARKNKSSGAKWLLRGPKGACLAAIIPGDSAAEQVVTTGLLSFINLYNFVLVVRVLLTWFPSPPRFIFGPVSTLADPYLNLFRGIIPPIGGTLDLSPVLAFVTINVFTNAAEALPCDLTTHAKRTSAEKDAATGSGLLGLASRMNPVLLMEGLRNRKKQENHGICGDDGK